MFSSIALRIIPDLVERVFDRLNKKIKKKQGGNIMRFVTALIATFRAEQNKLVKSMMNAFFIGKYKNVLVQSKMRKDLS